VCPVGAILPKHQGYEKPIGERLYDNKPVSVVGDVAANLALNRLVDPIAGRADNSEDSEG
jgi:hypothetical protein